MSFWLPSYREFKMFVGQLTAAAAGIEVSVRHVVALADTSSEPDPWSTIANQVGIRLDGMTSGEIAAAASRLQLVAAYSGFDAFLRGVRADWQRLHESEWRHIDGDAPFEEIRRNVARIGQTLEPEATAIDYFRRCRNWIVHPAESTKESASAFFKEQEDNLRQVRANWRRVGQMEAPNAPTDLSFHDVKLLARISLHVAELISVACDPGDEMLRCLVPISNWSRLAHDAEGQRRAVGGYLQTMFGIDRVRAEKIARAMVEAD
jgi:hypothetical protein